MLFCWCEKISIMRELCLFFQTIKTEINLCWPQFSAFQHFFLFVLVLFNVFHKHCFCHFFLQFLSFLKWYLYFMFMQIDFFQINLLPPFISLSGKWIVWKKWFFYVSESLFFCFLILCSSFLILFHFLCFLFSGFFCL